MTTPCETLLGKRSITNTEFTYVMLPSFTHSGQTHNMQTTAVVQGGFLCACLLDSARSALVASQSKSSRQFSQVLVMESKVSYLVPVRIGSLTCKVTLQRIGGSVSYVDVTAHQNDALVGTCSVTCLLSRKGNIFSKINPHSLTPPQPPPPPTSMTPESARVLTTGLMGHRPTAKVPNTLGTFFNSDHYALDIERGILWSTMNIAKDAMDDNGRVQAGFVTAMLDNCMAMLFMAFRRWTSFNAPTLEMQTHYFHPVEATSPCHFVTRIIFLSNRVGYLEVALRQEKLLCAKGKSTLLMKYAKV